MADLSNLTLDEILSIPGNRPVFETMLSNLGEGEAIAFVGAGASAGMYPLWGEFIDLLADYAVQEGKARPKDAARWKSDTSSTPQQRVSLIIRRLDEPRYRSFLRQTFSPREAADGKRYTPIHESLLRLPFRGYVTTNYDPALDFARMELRPRSLTTGTPTWEDNEEIYRWYNGDIFKRPTDCPILWLHGYWQRPGGIVLNSGEYSAAYKPSLYRRLFDALWGQRRLVFVGFGFNDPQFTFMVGEYLRDLRDASALPRHVAVLGLPLDADGTMPDDDAIDEWRDSLETDYHVRPLFYPFKGSDHSALRLLLDSAADACGSLAPAAAASTDASLPTPTTPVPAFAAKWFHEPSNDDKFLGRDDEIARLDRWVRDEAVRALGVSAVGGTGKTALVGHWLKNTGGWRTRPFAGLFAWSFYQNRDTRDFLREFLLWTHETLHTPQPVRDADLVDTAVALLRQHTLVVVLDGLEVLQEGPEDARHGTFLDGDLRELLTALCQREHRSLALLTSRFVFADLERFLGTTFHQLDLQGLSSERGGQLLDDLGVGGTNSERQHVSARLEGHPLGLRIFAYALPDEDAHQPRRFLDHAFRPAELPEGAPLNDKLRRLLVFYEQRLPPVQVRLLSIVALFRSPVSDEAVLRLTRGLFGQNGEDSLPDDAAISAELKRLQARGILSREPIEGGYGSACHPILRDHFRALLLRTGADIARRTADLLTGQPSNEQPQSVKEIEPVLLAIELLLDSGEFEAANKLYMERLERGKVFIWMPAPVEGMACALGFVRSDARQQQCEEKISRKGLAFYLNEVGLYAVHTGHLDIALQYYNDSNTIYREMQNAEFLSVGLQNESELLVILGQLAEARRSVTEALQLVSQERNAAEVRDCHAYRGWSMTISGQVYAAAEDFAVANELKKKDLENAELHGIYGIWWAEMLIRCSQIDLARRRTQANLQICERNRWNDKIAGCYWLLGWCSLAQGRLDEAKAELRQAEAIFQRGHLLFNLSRLHVTAGELALERGDAAGALYRAAEALALAAPRGMRLVHADALVLRGRARLLEGQPDGAGRALDDAEEALRLARECGYPWAERDALFLKADAHAALAASHQSADHTSAADREREAERRARADAEDLAARLVLTDEDLAAAEVKAVAWLKEWEKKGSEREA
ncbi:MAG TPA: SIR2 family protein [Pyrinomonadaceae bacterium]|jgi:tetratricopeptide (TPR) repeat protein